MPRVIIKLKDGEYINIRGDAIDVREGFVMAWDGESLVAVANAEYVSSAHISEGKEAIHNG